MSHDAPKTPNSGFFVGLSMVTIPRRAQDFSRLILSIAIAPFFTGVANKADFISGNSNRLNGASSRLLLGLALSNCSERSPVPLLSMSVLYSVNNSSNVTTDMLVTRDETCGPAAPIYRFGHEEEVINIANATEYGLAVYFHVRDFARVIGVAEALERGMVGVNTALLGADAAAFGEIKQSGIARAGSHHGISELVELKHVLPAAE